MNVRLRNVRFLGRVLTTAAWAIHAELSYCRAIRLALLARAHGGGWWRTLRTLVGTYDFSALHIGGHWFLIGPQSPRMLDRRPGQGRWAWYIYGPSLHRTPDRSLGREECAPGFSPTAALTFCQEWSDAARQAHQQRDSA
ncbi:MULTISPECIES: hypothetical protein [Nocardia]|uniref:Uncharacterized protein n=1 Tax=Nocardia ignorata TaxID=145285 RepID=A0A4R6PL70_NOCIG|nr:MULTISPECIES: hypothetical protein [Nocardia]MBC7302091.1 hypothetical protein [Nocardia sp.]TDP38556.1 hypothetical protein DFR75_103213 [Nocardia ignorata]